MPDLILILDAADQLGGCNSVPDCKLFRAKFIVHIGIVRAAIVSHDVSVIALVHAEHTRPLQTPRRNDARQRHSEQFHFFTSG